MELALILWMLAGGFVVGALARFAIPGPDPMPVWLTILIGIVGSFGGGGLGYAAAGEAGAFLASVIAASLLVVAYRRFVQRRTVTGPGARLPRRP